MTNILGFFFVFIFILHKFMRWRLKFFVCAVQSAWCFNSFCNMLSCDYSWLSNLVLALDLVQPEPTQAHGPEPRPTESGIGPDRDLARIARALGPKKIWDQAGSSANTIIDYSIFEFRFFFKIGLNSNLKFLDKRVWSSSKNSRSFMRK